jgi:hypothetical protein
MSVMMPTRTTPSSARAALLAYSIAALSNNEILTNEIVLLSIPSPEKFFNVIRESELQDLPRPSNLARRMAALRRKRFRAQSMAAAGKMRRPVA